MPIDTITDRMARLMGAHGEAALADALQAQALTNLGMTALVLVVLSEVGMRLWAAGQARAAAGTNLRGMALALALIVGVLAARLASGSEWAALFGHTSWMLATAAIAGADAIEATPSPLADGAELALSVHQALTGLATQSLLMAGLCMCWAVWVMRPALTRVPQTPPLLTINAAILVALLCMPTLLSPTVWSAAFGHTEAYAARITVPGPDTPAPPPVPAPAPPPNLPAPMLGAD